MTKQDKSISKTLVNGEMSRSIYVGRFRPAEGGTVPVTDKATGGKLFVAGLASVEDVAEAATWAEVQPDAQPEEVPF